MASKTPRLSGKDQTHAELVEEVKAGSQAGRADSPPTLSVKEQRAKELEEAKSAGRAKMKKERAAKAERDAAEKHAKAVEAALNPEPGTGSSGSGTPSHQVRNTGGEKSPLQKLGLKK